MKDDSRLQTYRKLKSKAKNLAKAILKTELRGPANPQIQYFLDQAKHIEKFSIENCSDVEGGIAGEIMDALCLLMPEFISGTLTSSQTLFKLNIALPGYWYKLMTLPPMGEYATLAAEFILSDEKLFTNSILELGSGVGNLTSLIAHKAQDYVRTDKESKLLNKRWAVREEVYDFNYGGAWKGQNLVVAVNAVHCATDKIKTLEHIYSMLKQGGQILLSEGQSPVCAGEPWALNLLFGLYDGWWDRGGFLERGVWTTYLKKAGFKKISYRALTAGEYDFGGIIWAEK